MSLYVLILHLENTRMGPFAFNPTMAPPIAFGLNPSSFTARTIPTNRADTSR